MPHGSQIVSTGEDDGDDFFNDVWALSFSGANDTVGTWTALDGGGSASSSSARPEVRYGSAGGVFGDNLVVAQGFGDDGRFESTHTFDLDEDEWTREDIGGSKPHARCLHAGAFDSDGVFAIFGGCGSGGYGPCPAGDTWQYDVDERKWEQVDSCPAPAQFTSMAPMFGLDRHILMYGGDSEDDSGRLAVLDTESGKWKRYLPEAVGDVPLGREGAMMATTDDAALVFGGKSTGDGDLLSDMWILTGDVDDSEQLDGCLTRFDIIVIHGILMFLGWGVCLQAGAFIARYLRHRDPLWFKLHRGLQMGGLVLALAGLGVAAGKGIRPNAGNAHHVIGFLVMLLGILQPIEAIFRPHAPKGEPKTMRRKIFEWSHKGKGRIALVLAIVQIFLGFDVIRASIAFHIVWAVLVAGLVAAYILFEVRLRRAPAPAVSDSDETEMATKDHSSKTATTTASASASESDS